MSFPSGEIGVLGAGHWGRNLARNFASMKALGALCDIVSDKANALSAQFGGQVMARERMLAEPAIAAVVIATPSHLHFEHVKEALGAGKHVFVEKPLALSALEANSLAQIAQDGQRKLMVGHLLQFHPAFQKMRELVKGGAIGSIRAISATRHTMGRIRDNDDALWDLAPHDVSMIRSLVGADPVVVTARGAAVKTPASVDVAHISLALPGTAIAQISVSRVHPFKEQRLIVVGDRGTIVFEDTNANPDRKLVIYPQTREAGDLYAVPPGDGKAIQVDRHEPLGMECRHFLECIRDDRHPFTDGREGADVVAVLEAAARSIHRNNGLLTPGLDRRNNVVVDLRAMS